VTDEQMRDIIDATESETAFNPLEFDCARTVTLKVALSAMRRVYDLGRKQEAAMWELAAENQRLGLE
jgi:hypothetical protein